MGEKIEPDHLESNLAIWIKGFKEFKIEITYVFQIGDYFKKSVYICILYYYPAIKIATGIWKYLMTWEKCICYNIKWLRAMYWII